MVPATGGVWQRSRLVRYREMPQHIHSRGCPRLVRLEDAAPVWTLHPGLRAGSARRWAPKPSSRPRHRPIRGPTLHVELGEVPLGAEVLDRRAERLDGVA